MTGGGLGQRPAEPGEVCTCGRPAVIVYVGGAFGETGYCGRQRRTARSCPWCPDGPHDGARCPAYRVRPGGEAGGRGGGAR